MTADIMLPALLAILVTQRLSELRLAKRNEAWARAQGAVEHGAAHYPLFLVLHTAWLVAWPLEAWLAGPSLAPLWPLGLGLFAAAQALRYWAIFTLGRRWNTRILVLAATAPIRRGPYRVMPHPNYVAVVVELAVVPLLLGAPWTAGIASLANLALLLGIRIPAETRALTAAAHGAAVDGPRGVHARSDSNRA